MEVDTELEKSLIGSILLKPNCLVEVSGKLSPLDFTVAKAGVAYSIMVSLWKDKKPVDLISITSTDSSLSSFMYECASKAAPLGVIDRAARVASFAKDRRITGDLKTIISSRLSPEDRLAEMLKTYQREVSVSAKAADIKSVIKRFDDRVAETKRRGRAGVSTGFGFLDDIYAEYIPGHIWTVGAATSVGKTALMTQKMCNLIAMDVCPSIIVVSTEMTEDQMVARILANFSGVHSQRILTGRYRAGEEELVLGYRRLVESKPIYIFDDIYFLDEIEALFRKADLQGGVDIGFIDYVQNCKVKGAMSEYLAQSTMAKDLQKLAKDVRCTLFCLSQVSNEVARGNTENLELKGAGEWAAVSDVSVHLTRNDKEKYLLRYTIKKNRHGALVDHMLEYKMDFTRLEPLKPYDEWKGK